MRDLRPGILMLAFLLLSISTAKAFYPSRCSDTCGRYEAYARGAGAAGSSGPLMSLYRQCMTCINSTGSQRRNTTRQRPACSKGKILRGGYCILKGASQCPINKARSCNSPYVCATDLKGTDRCFSKRGLQKLHAEMGRRKLKQRIAEREARETAQEKAFRKKNGLSYREWIENKRSLSVLLRRTPAEQKARIAQARRELQAAYEAQARIQTEIHNDLLKTEIVVRLVDKGTGMWLGPLYGVMQAGRSIGLGEKTATQAIGRYGLKRGIKKLSNELSKEVGANTAGKLVIKNGIPHLLNAVDMWKILKQYDLQKIE